MLTYVVTCICWIIVSVTVLHLVFSQTFAAWVSLFIDYYTLRPIPLLQKRQNKSYKEHQEWSKCLKQLKISQIAVAWSTLQADRRRSGVYNYTWSQESQISHCSVPSYKKGQQQGQFTFSIYLKEITKGIMTKGNHRDQLPSAQLQLFLRQTDGRTKWYSKTKPEQINPKPTIRQFGRKRECTQQT